MLPVFPAIYVYNLLTGVESQIIPIHGAGGNHLRHDGNFINQLACA